MTTADEAEIAGSCELETAMDNSADEAEIAKLEELAWGRDRDPTAELATAMDMLGRRPECRSSCASLTAMLATGAETDRGRELATAMDMLGRRHRDAARACTAMGPRLPTATATGVCSADDTMPSLRPRWTPTRRLKGETDPAAESLRGQLAAANSADDTDDGETDLMDGPDRFANQRS